MATPDVLVDRIEPDGMVVCSNGYTAVPIGTTFTAICKTRVTASLPDFATVELGVAARVALTLDEVFVFRKSLAEVPAGYSAGLRLHGEGLRDLSRLLGERQPGEFVHFRVS
ncbi:hypothetical protein [Ideonella paludis]|uniref:Uncharacterized protein n=1 Tax=Ideonella paludis TaxID=1233411 RepID=A0ABS5DZ69_9BURK|nr:hypothetical protein [Ideonella paludis]MBQ0936450.1 hypothetical protein [Ideonella paludis]